MLDATRWRIGRRERDAVGADDTNPILVAAAAHAREHSDTITVPDLARAVGVSECTLRRLVQLELALTCRDYLLQARLTGRRFELSAPAAGGLRSGVTPPSGLGASDLSLASGP